MHISILYTNLKTLTFGKSNNKSSNGRLRSSFYLRMSACWNLISTRRGNRGQPCSYPINKIGQKTCIGDRNISRSVFSQVLNSESFVNDILFFAYHLIMTGKYIEPNLDITFFDLTNFPIFRFRFSVPIEMMIKCTQFTNFHI